MPDKKPAGKGSKASASLFSEEEKAAAREAVRERRARARGGREDGERDVREKIAEMQPSSRVMAERLHALMKANAPELAPRTWYGMPAYAKDGELVCYFRPPEKFKTRYATLGFSDSAKLDEGRMWPTEFALTELTPVEEARIVALVKRAMG
jgi:uncharacterized protein YdhG (YjbR/CyaY superfamily)